jgi:hypothetical protein
MNERRPSIKLQLPQAFVSEGPEGAIVQKRGYASNAAYPVLVSNRVRLTPLITADRG